MDKKINGFLKNYQKHSYAHVPNQSVLLQEYGIDINDVIDCSLGTNPYGFSPEINKMLQLVNWGKVSKYPDGSYYNIKKAIGDFWSNTIEIDVDDIFLGTGASGILVNINKFLINTNSKTLGCAPQFPEYFNHVKIFGGRYCFINSPKENNFSFDGQKFIDSIDETYTVIFIDNPNNPTGQIIDLSTIESIVKKAHRLGVPVIIDEAYGDFMDQTNSAINIYKKYNNLMVIRSFSKGLGLANLRMGYILVRDTLKEYYNKVNLPPFIFPDFVEPLALEALKDKGFLEQCRQGIKRAKKELISHCSEFTVAHTDLEVPILLLGHVNEEVNLYDLFLQNGIITEGGQYFASIGSNYVRIRIPSDMDRLILRLDKIQKEIDYE